jgi:predicted GNAT family acetyltransferase
MSWELANKKTFPALKEFLVQKEWECTAFSSRFKKLLQPFQQVNKESSVLINKNGTKIHEAIMFTNRGLILPILNPDTRRNKSTDIKRIIELMHNFINGLHSIMGLFSSVRILEECITKVPAAQVEYYLMVLEKKNYHQTAGTLDKSFIIKQAKVKDAHRLFKLQKCYELEEVYINPDNFQPGVCLSFLKETLSRELVLMAEKNNSPVAKCGTNARGFFVDQIGGVYTDREFRNRGIGFQLLQHLLNEIFETKKTASLFVKKNNTRAIKMYEKAGFELLDSFRISYYF